MKSYSYPVNSRSFYGTSWPVLILSSIALSALLILCHNIIYSPGTVKWPFTQQQSVIQAERSNLPTQEQLAVVAASNPEPEQPAIAQPQPITPDSASLVSVDSMVIADAAVSYKKMNINELSVSDRKFMRLNDKKNDSIVKILSSTVDMYSFHFKYRQIDPVSDSMEDHARDSLLALYARGAKKYSKIVILGFTDSHGGKVANIKVGAERAEIIKNRLVQMGFSADRIVTASFGHKLPIDTNTTEAGRAHNRRVEVNIQDS